VRTAVRTKKKEISKCTDGRTHSSSSRTKGRPSDQMAKKCQEKESYSFEMETAGINLFIRSKFQC
jgi:hypothetical protein